MTLQSNDIISLYNLAQGAQIQASQAPIVTALFQRVEAALKAVTEPKPAPASTEDNVNGPK